LNVPSPSSDEFGLRERLRSAESRLRAADALATAARACLVSPGWETLQQLERALNGYEHPRLLGAPGRLLTDHRLPRAPAPDGDTERLVPASREVVITAFRLEGAAAEGETH
jgi:hypothetical protein